MWRTKKIRNIFVFIVLNLTAALRIAWLLLVEFIVAVADMVRAVTSGRKLYKEFLLLLSRVFVGVGLRELLMISGQIDVARGLHGKVRWCPACGGGPLERERHLTMSVAAAAIYAHLARTHLMPRL